MISLVITADTTNVNCEQKDREFANLLEKFKQPYEILYVANEDYAGIETLKMIAKQNTNRKLVVTSKSTNKNTQIYAALDHTDNGDVLLATIDTNVDLLTIMLQKRQNEAEIVFVRQKDNFFKSIFVGLGQFAYHTGLKILARGKDMCCDSQVILLNNRSVNTIILNPALSKALRLVNPDPERPARTVVAPKIYDTETPSRQKNSSSFLTLGIVSFFYIIAALLLWIAVPLNNSNVYPIIVLVGILVWFLIGVVALVTVAKYIFSSRLGLPIALDLSGEPVINITALVINQKEINAEGLLVDEHQNTSKTSAEKTKAKTSKTEINAKEKSDLKESNKTETKIEQKKSKK